MALDHLDYIKRENVSYISVHLFLNIKLMKFTLWSESRV